MAKPKRGRPTTFTPKLGLLICERIADGESLRSICDDEGMPSKSTVMLWLIAHSSFSDQYARAREMQADSFVDDSIDIADDARNDWMKKRVGEDEIEVLNAEHVQRSRLRIDARKWAASKLAPKKYGDKVTLAGDPDSPVAFTNKLALSDEQLAAIAAGGRGGTAKAPKGKA